MDRTPVDGSEKAFGHRLPGLDSVVNIAVCLKKVEQEQHGVAFTARWICASSTLIKVLIPAENNIKRPSADASLSSMTLVSSEFPQV